MPGFRRAADRELRYLIHPGLYVVALTAAVAAPATLRGTAAPPLHSRTGRARDILVVSYMGDGAMIVFRLPAPRPATRTARWQRSNGFIAITWIGYLPPVAMGKL
jgi:class 3 adenylate cyclase